MLLSAALLPAACTTTEENRPPNIVLVVADDLGYGDLGVYGQEHIRTPNLDRMAAEGFRFTQFYSGSTVCAPSRSVLMTGLHTGHTLVRGNANNGAGVPLRPEDVTIAEILRDAGYATGMFGKWGLGVEGTTGAPSRQGFNAFVGYLDQVHAHYYYVDHLWTIEDGTMQRLPVDSTRYSQDIIAEAALQFIDEHQDRPFFLYAPFTIPHAELAVPDSSIAPYRNEAGESIFPETPFPGGHYGAQPTPLAAYAGMVSHLDHDVGRILDRLERHGIAENTIVLFTSDNGPHEAGGYDPTFFDGNGPLRGVKRDLYEGGIRVPTIAWGPGTVPSGAVTDHVGYFADLLVTSADLAGTEVSFSHDGVSMAPLLTGREDAQAEHDYLYWEFYERGSAQAVRMKDWKAVRRPAFDGPIELYDLAVDIGETKNLADDRPAVVRDVLHIMEAAHVPDPQWTVR
ncbi:MAG: arylsulfatase [Rhodothermales bacterium]